MKHISNDNNNTMWYYCHAILPLWHICDTLIYKMVQHGNTLFCSAAKMYRIYILWKYVNFFFVNIIYSNHPPVHSTLDIQYNRSCKTTHVAKKKWSYTTNGISLEAQMYRNVWPSVN